VGDADGMLAVGVCNCRAHARAHIHALTWCTCVQGEAEITALKGFFGDEQARKAIRAKVAGKLRDVVQEIAKNFTFNSGFHGYSWAAVLTSLAHQSEDGKTQLKWVVQLIKWELTNNGNSPSHLDAAAVPEESLAALGNAKGVVNLFASIIQSEDLPLDVAAEIAEATIGKGKGDEVSAGAGDRGDEEGVAVQATLEFV